MSKKSSKAKEAPVEQNKLAVIQSPGVNQFQLLISQAIDKKVPVDTMERLLTMFEKVKATQAKEEFDRALAEFQFECPIIEKSKKVDFTSKRTGGKTSYSYAPIDVIVDQVKPFLQKHGFSYSVNAKVKETSMVAVCKLTHAFGHSEISEFEVPIDKESFMNAQQQFAAALTFAKRYAFCNALGIMTGDEDTDAVDASVPKQDEPAEFVCSEHGETMKLNPAGVSKAGNPYKAFWSCAEKPNGGYCKAPILNRAGDEVRQNRETGDMEVVGGKTEDTDINQLVPGNVPTTAERAAEIMEGEIVNDPPKPAAPATSIKNSASYWELKAKIAATKNIVMLTAVTKEIETAKQAGKLNAVDIGKLRTDFTLKREKLLPVGTKE